MTATEIALVAMIGLAAGALGGLAGIGGSMVTIPALALLLGQGGPPGRLLHLIMAVAMTTNVLVALPAALRHARAGAVRAELARILIPAMAATVIVGVLVSNATPTEWLRRLLAAFIAAYALLNIVRAIRRRPDSPAEQQRTTWPYLVANGGVAGLVSGLLGLGGGLVMVPLLQVVSKVPLREAIATSLTVIFFTASIGAGLKLATLHTHGLAAADALVLVLAMAPAAIIGGHLGAALTHALPLAAVRIVISALMLIVASKLAGLL